MPDADPRGDSLNVTTSSLLILESEILQCIFLYLESSYLIYLDMSIVCSKLTGQECISLVTVATNNLITSGGLQWLLSRDVAQLSREV